MNNILLNKSFIKYLIFICIYIFAFLPSNIYSKEDFFSNPSLCLYEDFMKELEKKKFDMSWYFDQNSCLFISSSENNVYFEISLELVSDQYKDILMKYKDQFIEKINKDSKSYIFSYWIKFNEIEERNSFAFYTKKSEPIDYSYLISDVRIIQGENPTLIDQDQLIDIIQKKNILFYTGAGLSIDAGIPAMDELMDFLGISKTLKFKNSLEEALIDPKKFSLKIHEFYKSCFYSLPTKAHLALKDLSLYKNSIILTENFDNLHEASGIYPYRINPKQLQNEVEGEELKKINYIICIGLSHDDRGFLGWYKKINPDGKIIAIDLKRPTYLGKEDFLLLGDLQVVLPSIQQNILNKN